MKRPDFSRGKVGAFLQGTSLSTSIKERSDALELDVLFVLLDFCAPLFADRNALLLAVVIPDRTEGRGLEFFKERETLRVVEIKLVLTELLDRFEGGAEERFNRVTRSRTVSC